MKFLGTDFSRKYLIAEIDGKEVTISFYGSFWKGIYGSAIWVDSREISIKIKSTYPGFIRRIQEAMLLLCIKLKYLANHITRTRG